MTDRYAVMGNPISHTRSPAIHGEFARLTAQDLTYEAIEPPLGGFSEALKAFDAQGGRGLNVTAPFKVEAFEAATERSERAQLAGAANFLALEDGHVRADNFDGVGLVRDIEVNLGVPLRGRRVLLMGAGGAARGVALPFLQRAPALLFIANRTVSKAMALGERFRSHGSVEAGGYQDIGERHFDVVVNATSASLRGELPAVPPSALTGAVLAYELVYGKGPTPFLRLAGDAGVQRRADGVGMLVEQAAEAFAAWRGVRPVTRELIRSMSVPI